MKWFGLEIPAITHREALLRLPHSRIIFTPNPEILLEASRNSAFLNVLKKADLLLPDGHGLQMISTLRPCPRLLRFLLLPSVYILYLLKQLPCDSVYPEIIHGSDFMEDVLNYAHRNHLKVFFLGSTGPVLHEVVQKASRSFPGLKIVGSSPENPGSSALRSVRNARPDIVLVAYGAPKQEFFIHEMASQLIFVKHFMGVGGSFDYYAGAVKRAPKLMQVLGLEWLFRLFLEPRKRIPRIWNAVVVFPLKSVFFETER